MTTINPSTVESEERTRLEKAKQKIQIELDRVNASIGARSRDMIDLKKYLSESKADMDHVEKAGVRQTVEEMGVVGDHTALGAAKLGKVLDSPYFGRIDFRPDGEDSARPVYVGIHSFYGSEEEAHLVHDWRAPIASMFYDFETGEASYEARDSSGIGVCLYEQKLPLHDSDFGSRPTHQSKRKPDSL